MPPRFFCGKFFQKTVFYLIYLQITPENLKFSFGREVTFSNHIAAKLKNITPIIILLCCN